MEFSKLFMGNKHTPDTLEFTILSVSFQECYIRIGVDKRIPLMEEYNIPYEFLNGIHYYTYITDTEGATFQQLKTQHEMDTFDPENYFQAGRD